MTPDELALALEAKRPEMVNLARSFLRSRGLEHEAEDLVQDAMIKILSLDNLTFENGVGGLFATTLIQLARPFARDVQRHIPLDDEYTRIYQPDSQAHIRQRERLNVDVALALDKLDPEVRQVVRSVWMEDHTWRRTAHTLKISEHTVQADLDEARPILRHELARYDHRRRPLSRPAEDRCLASQPPYKKEAGETDTPMPSGGNGAEIVLTETDRRFQDEIEADLLGAELV